MDMDSSACSVRVDADTLGLRWPAHLSPPNLEHLIPFHGGKQTAPKQTSYVSTHRIDTLGLFHQGPRSPIKNLLYIGNAVLPHQGLETECWTAMTAANLLTEALSKRWRLSARI